MALTFPGPLTAAQQAWLRATQTPVCSITLAKRTEGRDDDLALWSLLQVCLGTPSVDDALM